MAGLNCCGDCRNCEPLKNGETDPAQCASVWGFIHIQGMWRELKTMREEIASLIEANKNKDIPGIDDERESSSKVE